MGRHKLDPATPYLIYMPHCSRALYESILHTNFEPSLAKQPIRVILGNDLAEYIGFVRQEAGEGSSQQPAEEEFTKAKKKRKGKTGPSAPKDGVLERLGMF
jgi:DnaJ family protein A protein 5